MKLRSRPPAAPAMAAAKTPNRTKRAVAEQNRARARRHQGHAPYYTGTFSLAAEFDAIFGPCARTVVELSRPRACREAVLDCADAAHEAVSTVRGWTAEVDARAHTEHLADEPGKRLRAIQLLVDTAPRPALPSIHDDDIAAGIWPDVLVAMAAEVDAELSALLARAYPPEHPALRGRPSRSERLSTLLSQTVDRAASALDRRASRVADWVPAPPTPDPVAELRALGFAR